MLLVDAFNVLHRTGVLPPELAGPELRDLAALVGASRYRGEAVVLVCDGVCPGVGHAGPAATRIGEARVLYAGGGREADDEIERLIGVSTTPRRLTVVSDDRRLRRAARRRGARSMRSGTFLGQLARDAERRKVEPLPGWVHAIPLSAAETARWLEEFGFDPGAAADASSEAGPADAPIGSSGATPASLPDQGGHGGEGSRRRREAAELDESSRRLFEASSIDPDDLDMERWLGRDGGAPEGRGG